MFQQFKAQSIYEKEMQLYRQNTVIDILKNIYNWVLFIDRKYVVK